jgi:hypothetical protein
MKRPPPPGDIRARHFRFDRSALAKNETSTVEEMRDLLGTCDSLSDRTRLDRLPMRNAGMYQRDLAEPRADESFRSLKYRQGISQNTDTEVRRGASIPPDDGQQESFNG